MTSSSRPAIGLVEFVALMATMTALVAMSIDMILPALPAIGTTLGVARANDNQLVVSLLFLGFGLGQLFYGPLSDAVGRKSAAYAGLALFMLGCVLALLSTTLPMIVFSSVRMGLSPQINALATLLILAVSIAAVLAFWLLWRDERRRRAETLLAQDDR